MFTGSFQEMWVNLGAVLGNDMKITSTQLDNYYASSVSLDSSRDGVSAVDLNDEATNLIQYTKSYQAACRLMTTIDTVLDKLINNTGVTT
jgi:flagellar hook-associated protein 1 FlgK